MTNALHASHYADRAIQARTTVLENVRLARDTYRVRFHCPAIARAILPGQFVMLRLVGGDDPLLARPLALYDTVLSDGEHGEPVGLDVVYLVVGKMTRRLAEAQPGRSIELWGPLGNGFAPRGAGRLVMVAGGIGQTPFMALAREHLGLRAYGTPAREVVPNDKVTLCYGARTKDYLAGVDDFERLGVQVRVSTDDGTAGHHGLVTEVLAQVLDEANRDGAGGNASVACCGPEPMMEAVARMTLERGIECQVSLETPMACGVGICFSCVTRVRTGEDTWDYRRTCVEGPIFDAARLAW